MLFSICLEIAIFDAGIACIDENSIKRNVDNSVASLTFTAAFLKVYIMLLTYLLTNIHLAINIAIFRQYHIDVVSKSKK